VIRCTRAEECNWDSDGDDLARVDLHPDEHRVILDEVALLGHFVGDEAGKAEAERVGLATRPLEVLPGRVGNEALDDVAGLLGDEGLVQQREGHAVGEGPTQQGVVLAGQDLYVDGDVGALAGPVAVQEQGSLQGYEESRGYIDAKVADTKDSIELLVTP
jgi:hypothetical protein